MKAGDIVKAKCKCGQLDEYPLREYSNGTLHAMGKCLKCGLTSAKAQMDLKVDLEQFKHLINKARFEMQRMVDDLTRDEAVAMLERLAMEFRREEKW